MPWQDYEERSNRGKQGAERVYCDFALGCFPFRNFFLRRDGGTYQLINISLHVYTKCIDAERLLR